MLPSEYLLNLEFLQLSVKDNGRPELAKEASLRTMLIITPLALKVLFFFLGIVSLVICLKTRNLVLFDMPYIAVGLRGVLNTYYTYTFARTETSTVFSRI